MLIIGPKSQNTTPTQLSSSTTVQAPATTQQVGVGIIFDDKLCDCPPSSRSKLPGIDEATVLTEVEVNTATHLTTRKDPLIVRGTAKPGATVRVYNPDIRGWPEVAQAIAHANGKYAVQVDDQSLFARGDRVLVTAHEPGRQPSGGVLRATVPFTQTNHVHSTYLDGTLTNRTSRSTVTPDLADADDRAPYYDASAVRTTSRLERGGMRLELTSATKAVPPGSKLSIGGATAVAGDDGRFSLTVRNAQPGSTLELRITDIHGRVSTAPVTVRSLQAELRDFTAAARWTSSGTVGVRVSLGLTAGDALTLRDVATGASQRLVADAAGKIDGALSGLTPWSTLEVGLETQGIRANQLTRLVVLPSECGGALHLLDDAWCEPSLGKALSTAKLDCIDGQDVLVLPPVDHMPPFGRIEVLRGTEVAYELRADAKGRTPEAGLAGATPGEVLSVRSYDAGGRRLGVDVPSFVVPAEGELSYTGTVRASENARLGELVGLIGTGSVMMPATGEGAQISARLVPDPSRLRPAIEKNAASGRTELSGAFPAGTMPEATGAGAYDSVRLAVVDWDTGQRNMVFELFRNNQMTQTAVRVPLQAVTVNGQAALPDAAQTVAMLGRAVAFAGLAQSLGAGPGEAAYDGPMRAARSLIHALDRIAVKSPDTAASLREQAAAAIAAGGAEQVDASRWVPGTDTRGATPAGEVRSFWGAAKQKQGLKPWEVLRAG